MNRFLRSFAVAAGKLLLVLSGSAQIVTFQTPGVKTNGSELPFSNGGSFVWTVSLDLGAPLVTSSGSSENGWARYDAVTAISLDYNDGEYADTHTFSIPASVLVQNHSSGDIFSINYFGSGGVLTEWPLVNGKQVLLGNPQIITFSTAAGNALSSWDLVSPVGLDWFDTGADATDVFHFSFSGGGGVDGNVLSLSAIPEPSTYAAFAGLGALGLAFWRRRQAKSAV